MIELFYAPTPNGWKISIALEEIELEYCVTADMAIWPWVHLHDMHRQNLDEFPQVRRWYEHIGRRGAVQRGVSVLNDMFTSQSIDEEGRKVLFGQQRR